MSKTKEGFEVDYITEIGVGFLESFVNRLYSEPYQVIREFVSNSVDALANKIQIDCTEPSYDTIIIRDDGVGIKDLNELEKALSLMMSIKKDESLIIRHPPIGYFGIGFFSGGKICKTIEIQTTAQGSDLLVEARIPMGEWMEKFNSKDARYTSLFEVTRYEKKQTRDIKYKDMHFTVVILHDLDDKIKEIFKNKAKKQNFIEQISRIIPVDYDPEMNLTITKFIPEKLNELEIQDGTELFHNWLKEVLEDKMAQNGIPFSCRYNNVNIEFNGVPIYRPYPKGGVNEEPLDSKESWRFKEFKIEDENGKEVLVGIGWAVIRGSRLKKGKTVKEPIEGGGDFKTKSIQGMQIRLYNVEVISHNRVYAMFDVKISHQPVGQIWGEIYLFNKDIMIDPKRENFVNEGLTKTVRQEIKNWIEETLKYTEDRRHDKTSWKKVLKNYNNIKTSISNTINKVSEKTKKYKKETDSVKKFIENWKKNEYKTLKDKLNKSIKNMEDEFKNIKTLNYVVDTLENLIKESNTEKNNFIPRIENYIKTVLEGIKYQEERIKLKEELKEREEKDKEGTDKKEDKEDADKKEDKEDAGKKEEEEDAGKKEDEEDADKEEDKDDTDEINEWEQFKEFVFPSYELNPLEVGLLTELIEVIDLCVENLDDKINIMNRVLLLLNEQIQE